MYIISGKPNVMSGSVNKSIKLVIEPIIKKAIPILLSVSFFKSIAIEADIAIIKSIISFRALVVNTISTDNNPIIKNMAVLKFIFLIIR